MIEKSCVLHKKVNGINARVVYASMNASIWTYMLLHWSGYKGLNIKTQWRI